MKRIWYCMNMWRAWGSVVVKALRYNSEGPGIDTRCRRGFFPWHLTVPCALGSTLKNEYQVNPGGKGGRCVRLTTYHIHVPIVKKSGGLNLLEPCGPVQACNGTALHLSFTFYLHITFQNYAAKHRPSTRQTSVNHHE